MTMHTMGLLLAGLFIAAPSAAQPGRPPGQPPGPPAPLPPGQSADPFPSPIATGDGVIRVKAREFASLPDIDGVAARMMNLVQEPATRRLFVNDMRGPIYGVSDDGARVGLYLDINDKAWGVSVQSAGRERGFQSFTFHPQFGQPGTRGFGRFYTYTDTTNQTPAPDFTTNHTATTHDTVLLEWTARTPGAPAYDGGPPRELMRFRQPYANHNAGHIAFHPTASAGSPEFGLLYIGVADGGSGGDPLRLSQNLGSAFGKIFRIDPLGASSANRQYGNPASNPFVKREGALPEIYAYGVRNPQRFAWDSRTGALFVADIGQNVVEEISPVTSGANLGWNDWEGSFRFVSRQAVDVEKPRSDPSVTFPIAEWDQTDPLLQRNAAASGLLVYRGSLMRQLANLLVFTDMPSGEIFYVSADRLPDGGQDAIRRILLDVNGTAKTALEVMQEKNRAQGKPPAPRADLRLNLGHDDQVFLLNKADGTIRVLVP
jgi:hypothetical protein